MNVVLLTIDALRWDRFGSNGYRQNLTPEMDAMLGHALTCKWTYSISPSTSSAFPSIFTSTRPLSFGGFDCGVLNRPPILSTVLSRAGYKVVHMSTVPWINAALGYGVGVDLDFVAYDFAMLARTGTPLMRAKLDAFNRGSITIAELRQYADAVLPCYFESLIRYCEQGSTGRHPAGKHEYWFPFQSYAWNRLARYIAKQHEAYASNRDLYLSSAADHYRRTEQWILDRSWRRYRPFQELFQSGIRYGAARSVRFLKPNLSRRLQYRRKQQHDARTLIDAILGVFAQKQNASRPLFVWAHVTDCHIPYSCGSQNTWKAETAQWLQGAGYRGDIDPTIAYAGRPNSSADWEEWRALYDASVHFIDFHVGRLRRSLAAAGSSDTLIVVASDHGEELGEHGDNSHRFRLYEHNTHVQVFYYHPELRPTSVDGFSTIMDIGPTILNLVSAPAPPGWSGESLLKLRASPRSEVLLETTFGSPSDARYAPVYFAVRRGNYKLMYNRRVNSRDHLSHEGELLFDVVRDPLEQHNLSGVEPCIVQQMMIPIRNRSHELEGRPTPSSE